MALKTSTGFSGDSNLIFLSARGKDPETKEKVKPFFSISKATPEGIKPTGETCNEISGSLFRAELTEKTFKNIPTRVVNLYFKDGDEAYMLGLTYATASRSLFNALISLENDFDDLNIQIYRNKGGYEAFAIKQGGKRLDWKYKIEELPEAKEVVINRQKQHDFSDVDEFFDNELKALQSRIEAVNGKKPETTDKPATPPGAKTPAPAKPAASKPTTPPPPAEDDTIDEVPF